MGMAAGPGCPTSDDTVSMLFFHLASLPPLSTHSPDTLRHIETAMFPTSTIAVHGLWCPEEDYMLPLVSQSTHRARQSTGVSVQVISPKRPALLRWFVVTGRVRECWVNLEDSRRCPICGSSRDL